MRRGAVAPRGERYRPGAQSTAGDGSGDSAGVWLLGSGLALRLVPGGKRR